MTSTNDSTAHAPASALVNSKPSAVAKAAVDGAQLPESQLEDLASKLDIKDATTSNADDAAAPANGEAAAVKKKKASSKTKSTTESSASKTPTAGSSRVQNLATYDPFADAEDDELADTQGAVSKSTRAPEYVHIRIQQRNGRKTLTTVQGVPNEYDPKKLLKHFKKEYACNGTLVDDEEGQVIQLQGDQRAKISQTLIEDVGLPKESIKIHGF